MNKITRLQCTQTDEKVYRAGVADPPSLLPTSVFRLIFFCRYSIKMRKRDARCAPADNGPRRRRKEEKRLLGFVKPTGMRDPCTINYQCHFSCLFLSGADCVVVDSGGGEPLFAGIRAAATQPDGDSGRRGRPVLSRRSSRRLQSRLDQIRLESHPGHPHARHHAQLAGVRQTFRPHRLAIGDRRRPAGRRGPIHVPNQHGSNEKSGMI